MNKAQRGIGVIGVLQIVFIVLKLCGLINWSWRLVLSPILIEASVLVVCLMILGIAYLCDKK